MATAVKATRPEGSGTSTTRRKDTTTLLQTISLPSKITSGVFKNAGGNDIVIRINASGTNFWTLRPGEQTPKVYLGGTIDYKSIGGTSVLECIFEG